MLTAAIPGDALTKFIKALKTQRYRFIEAIGFLHNGREYYTVKAEHDPEMKSKVMLAGNIKGLREIKGRS